MAPPTRSSPAPSSDSVLHLIDERLLALTQELTDFHWDFTQDLTDIHKNITDLTQTVTGFQKEIPHHFETIQDQQSTFQTNTSICPKLADTAVELSEFQQNVESKLQDIHEDHLIFMSMLWLTIR